MTEQEILSAYPEIFKEKDLSPQESTMHWGLEVPDRWLPAIEAACKVLQSRRDNSIKYKRKGDIPFPQFVAEQVKSKFRSPRFYYRLEWDDVNYAETSPEKAQEQHNEHKGFVDGVMALTESVIINEDKQFRELEEVSR